MEEGKITELRLKHPNWYSATDYRWLREHKVPKVDISQWNRLDDSNRREMANWSYNEFSVPTFSEE